MGVAVVFLFASRQICIFIVLGENSIVIISGANLLLTEDDVKAAKDVITSASVVVCQLEIKPEVTQVALSIAKKAGGKMWGRAPL